MIPEAIHAPEKTIDTEAITKTIIIVRDTERRDHQDHHIMGAGLPLIHRPDTHLPDRWNHQKGLLAGATEVLVLAHPIPGIGAEAEVAV